LFEFLGGIDEFSAEFVSFRKDSRINVSDVTVMEVIDLLESWCNDGHFVDVRNHNIEDLVEGANVIDFTVVDNDLLTLKKH
jgi:hypothetical protein